MEVSNSRILASEAICRERIFGEAERETKKNAKQNHHKVATFARGFCIEKKKCFFVFNFLCLVKEVCIRLCTLKEMGQFLFC